MRGGGGGRWSSSHPNVSANKQKMLKKYENFLLEGSQLFMEFCFLWGGSGNLTPAKSDG